MKITIDNEMGKKVKRIFLDGKPLASAVAADTEEGWVKVLVMSPTSVVEVAPPNPDLLSTDDEDQESVGELVFQEKLLHGNVTIEWLEEKENE